MDKLKRLKYLDKKLMSKLLTRKSRMKYLDEYRTLKLELESIFGWKFVAGFLLNNTI